MCQSYFQAKTTLTLAGVLLLALFLQNGNVLTLNYPGTVQHEEKK